jgi:hypothetical protein
MLWLKYPASGALGFAVSNNQIPGMFESVGWITMEIFLIDIVEQMRASEHLHYWLSDAGVEHVNT